MKIMKIHNNCCKPKMGAVDRIQFNAVIVFTEESRSCLLATALTIGVVLWVFYCFMVLFVESNTAFAELENRRP